MKKREQALAIFGMLLIAGILVYSNIRAKTKKLATTKV